MSRNTRGASFVFRKRRVAHHLDGSSPARGAAKKATRAKSRQKNRFSRTAGARTLQTFRDSRILSPKHNINSVKDLRRLLGCESPSALVQKRTVNSDDLGSIRGVFPPGTHVACGG